MADSRDSAEIDALLREAYRRGYNDRAEERDYDPGYALDLLTPPAVVPDTATGRLLVKRGGVTVSMTPEEYATTRPLPSGDDHA